jgi:RNA polymerase sigma factor (sigma-70 family)
VDARTLTLTYGQRTSREGRRLSQRLAQHRRQAAFEAVYSAHFHRLAGYALRRAASPEDAADAVAETFLIAWRKFDDMPGNDETLLWLYGIARRVLANRRRSEKRRAAANERLVRELAIELGHVADQASVHDPEVELARSALTSLKDKGREALLLVVWEELTPTEAARVLRCTPNALRIRLHRARPLERRDRATQGARGNGKSTVNSGSKQE